MHKNKQINKPAEKINRAVFELVITSVKKKKVTFPNSWVYRLPSQEKNLIFWTSQSRICPILV